tara:strand:- start:320 stop:493 length:174 start_codon:yes stop_codon:yes gene_type:complete
MFENEKLPSKSLWVLSVNYIKNYSKLPKIFPGLGLKMLAYLALLTYWAIIILGTFSL